MDPLVSVIIPAYNAEKTLAEAIRSALTQAHTATEVIVVDDGSRDRTLEVANSFGGRVRVHSQENKERAAARNTGAMLSSGEDLCFLDADDTVLPDKCSKQVLALSHHPDAAVCYGKVEARQANGESEILGKGSPGLGDCYESLLFENSVPIQSTLVCRSAFFEVGGFQEHLAHLEDWDLWLRLAARHPFLFLDEVVAEYRASDRSEFIEKCGRFQLHRTTSQVIAAALSERPTPAAGLRSKAMATAYFREARFALVTGKWKYALARYLRSAKTDRATFLNCHWESFSRASHWMNAARRERVEES